MEDRSIHQYAEGGDHEGQDDQGGQDEVEAVLGSDEGGSRYLVEVAAKDQVVPTLVLK